MEVGEENLNRQRMGDKPSSSVAPRKMKFTPKIPLRKRPKTPAPKLEEPDTHVGDPLDSRLLRIVKQAEHTSRRSPIFERKASMEIIFGRIVEENKKIMIDESVGVIGENAVSSCYLDSLLELEIQEEKGGK